MRMYLQLPEPLEREELVHRGRVPTTLSRAMPATSSPPPSQYDLTFTQTADGQVEITSLSRLSRARILDSFEVPPACSCAGHMVDGIQFYFMRQETSRLVSIWSCLNASVDSK